MKTIMRTWRKRHKTRSGSRAVAIAGILMPRACPIYTAMNRKDIYATCTRLIWKNMKYHLCSIKWRQSNYKVGADLSFAVHGPRNTLLSATGGCRYMFRSTRSPLFHSGFQSTQMRAESYYLITLAQISPRHPYVGHLKGHALRCAK